MAVRLAGLFHVKNAEVQKRNRQKTFKWWSLFSTLFVIVVISGCHRLFPSYTETTVTFDSAGVAVSGKMILPNNKNGPFPVVVFVHGDGPVPYDCYGYYRFMWERLAKAGIASFSWNKPGIGDSGGHWESQSMDDRAEEAIAAISYLQGLEIFDQQKIGLIGFSQAGWVLPIVATKSKFPDFMVVVSGAVNWLKQSEYLTESRLKQEGVSEGDIHRIKNFNKKELEFIREGGSYDEYLRFRDKNASEFIKNNTYTLEKRRFNFVKRNWNYDIREPLTKVRSPVLLMLGEEDLNVNVKESESVYKEILGKSDKAELTVKVFPNANHSLIKVDYFNEVSPGAKEMLKLEAFGERVFADGALDAMIKWIKIRSF